MLEIVYVDNAPVDDGLGVTVTPVLLLTPMAYAAALTGSVSPAVLTAKSLMVWTPGLVTLARMTESWSPALTMRPTGRYNSAEPASTVACPGRTPPGVRTVCQPWVASVTRMPFTVAKLVVAVLSPKVIVLPPTWHP